MKFDENESPRHDPGKLAQKHAKLLENALQKNISIPWITAIKIQIKKMRMLKEVLEFFLKGLTEIFSPGLGVFV